MIVIGLVPFSVMTGGMSTVKVVVTSGAGLKSRDPDWSAASVTVPEPVGVTRLLVIVAEPERTERVVGNPELATGEETVNPIPTGWGVMAAKGAML